ncbi:hypothetical protein BH23ACT3_BH23ACT3_12450 [soil metagenome]
MAFVRRLLLLFVLIAGAGYTGYAVLQRRGASGGSRGTDAPPEWPPFPAPTSPPNTVRTWVEPDAGSCPIDHPVKLNEGSGIFHVPGGRFYDRTSAHRCYASAEAAAADGYRQAKA